MGTTPEHQRRELARARIGERLRRLRHMGALVAFVSGYSPAANALYAAAVSPDCDLSEPWVKSC